MGTYSRRFFVTMVPIESINGKLAPQSQKMKVGATEAENLRNRYFYGYGKLGTVNWMAVRSNSRKTSYNAQELALQQKFKTTTANTNARLALANPADVSAFKAQTKYKTLRGYIFADEYAKL